MHVKVSFFSDRLEKQSFTVVSHITCSVLRGCDAVASLLHRAVGPFDVLVRAHDIRSRLGVIPTDSKDTELLPDDRFAHMNQVLSSVMPELESQSSSSDDLDDELGESSRSSIGLGRGDPSDEKMSADIERMAARVAALQTRAVSLLESHSDEIRPRPTRLSGMSRLHVDDVGSGLMLRGYELGRGNTAVTSRLRPMNHSSALHVISQPRIIHSLGLLDPPRSFREPPRISSRNEATDSKDRRSEADSGPDNNNSEYDLLDCPSLEMGSSDDSSDDSSSLGFGAADDDSQSVVSDSQLPELT
jgi:hypothetical protein